MFVLFFKSWTIFHSGLSIIPVLLNLTLWVNGFWCLASILPIPTSTYWALLSEHGEVPRRYQAGGCCHRSPTLYHQCPIPVSWPTAALPCCDPLLHVCQQSGRSEVLWVPDPAKVCSFTPPWAAFGLMMTAMRFEWFAVGHTESEWEKLFYGRFLSALKHAAQNPLASCLNR